MSEYNKTDRELTDDAWSRLQNKLAQEPKAEQWSRWSEERPAEQPPLAAMASATALPLLNAATEPSAASGPALHGLTAEPNTGAWSDSAKKSRPALGWMQKHKNWIGGAAAAIVLTVVIATPSGNEALAAILNKFRMQQVTVVQENDLTAILNGAFEDGKSREAVNKFGTFTHASGTAYGEMSVEEASKKLGHKVFIPKEYDAANRSLYVSPSSSITFKMNVDEVNKAMSRLGATKLLPVSVNGKPITLETGEAVHLYVQNDAADKRSPGYSLSQQPVPTLTVDPSIPVSEALDAVLQFPMLPESLKESLQNANVLNGGAIPMPVIANGQTEKTSIDGRDVIIITSRYGKETAYSATWVDRGQLLRLDGGNALPTRQALLDKVSELIRS